MGQIWPIAWHSMRTPKGLDYRKPQTITHAWTTMAHPTIITAPCARQDLLGSSSPYFSVTLLKKGLSVAQWERALATKTKRTLTLTQKKPRVLTNSTSTIRSSISVSQGPTTLKFLPLNSGKRSWTKFTTLGRTKMWQAPLQKPSVSRLLNTKLSVQNRM